MEVRMYVDPDVGEEIVNEEEADRRCGRERTTK